MEINKHNEIIELSMNVLVENRYKNELDKIVTYRKNNHSAYVNIFINCLINGKSDCIRTKSCTCNEALYDELRNKYLTIYKLSIKNNCNIKIVKMTISNQGCS
jgi:hypothetical protein